MSSSNFVQEILGQYFFVAVDFTNPGNTPLEVSVANNAFTSATLINAARGYDNSTSTETEEIVDLNNQSNAAATVRHVRAVDTKISGSGMIHEPDLYLWDTWSRSGQPKNVMVTVGSSHIIIGSYSLTAFSVKGDRQKGLTADITLEQSQPTFSVANGTSVANAVANAVYIGG